MEQIPLDIRPVSYSRTENVHILMSGDMNGANRLFGGILMQWIDIAAAVCARRHSGHEVTTASIENLSFKRPALINETVYLRACVVYVGNTSMDVKVSSYVEDLNGNRSLINTAYLVMVALDDNGKPTQVPRLICETELEKQENEMAIKRRELRKLQNKN